MDSRLSPRELRKKAAKLTQKLQTKTAAEKTKALEAIGEMDFWLPIFGIGAGVLGTTVFVSKDPRLRVLSGLGAAVCGSAAVAALLTRQSARKILDAPMHEFTSTEVLSSRTQTSPQSPVGSRRILQ